MKKSAFFSLTFICIFFQSISFAQWSIVGKRTFSPNTMGNQSLAFDKSGTPYIAFSDGGDNNKATVMKFNGADWVVVGSRGFSYSQVMSTSMVIDTNDNIYVAYIDHGLSDRASVKKFDGTNWSTVGVDGFTSNNSGGVKIVLDTTGVPYVAFIDGSTFLQPTVMKFNGVNWVVVGTSGFSAGIASHVDLKIDANNTPYVVYQDYANGYKPSVKKFNGTNWVQVGIPGFAPNVSGFTTLAIHPDGTPYVGFMELDNKYRPAVMKFNGLSWAYVGGSEITSDSISNPLLAIDRNGTPFISFTERKFGYRATVMRYTNNWKTVGRPAFTSGRADAQSFGINKYGSLFIAYPDTTGISNNGQYATVMTFNCPQQTSAALCVVTTDTVSGNNVIIWNAGAFSNIDSFRVYREQNGNFLQIGNTTGSSGSFTDLAATPSNQGYAYKISTFDSCGGSTDLVSSPAHRAIKLTYKHVPNGLASLHWNTYEGMAVTLYHVKRSNNNGMFTTIASFTISGSDTTFVDSLLPSGENRYRIDAELSNFCIINGISYNISNSNTVSAWSTGVDEISTAAGIRLFPNPVSGIVKIIASEPIVALQLSDVTGRMINYEKLSGDKEVQVDMTSLPGGMYFLKINGYSVLRVLKQ